MTLNRAISAYKRATNELSSDRAFGNLLDETVWEIQKNKDVNGTIKYVLDKLQASNPNFAEYFTKTIKEFI